MMAHPPSHALSWLATSALLGIVEQAGLAVLTLAENLTEDELLRSRLTRAEVQRQLTTLADSLVQLAPSLHTAMPDLGWEGWQSLQAVLHGPPGPALDDALWFASSSLVPATVLWLRVYRKEKPELFRMTA
jgi:uncharacterized protein with HEPN domain